MLGTKNKRILNPQTCLRNVSYCFSVVLVGFSSAISCSLVSSELRFMCTSDSGGTGRIGTTGVTVGAKIQFIQI